MRSRRFRSRRPWAAVLLLSLFASLSACSPSADTDISWDPAGSEPVPPGPTIRVEIARGSFAKLASDRPLLAIDLRDGRPLHEAGFPLALDLHARGEAEVEIDTLRLRLRLPLPLALEIVPPDGPASAESRDESRTSADPAGVPVFASAREGATRLAPGSARTPTVPRFALAVENGERLEYSGRLELLDDGAGALRFVVSMPLEVYLLGVVGSEMPALYPAAAVRAQAIASRTYALHAWREAADRGERVVFAANQRFQVYRGFAPATRPHPRVVDAVRATRGQVLSYRGRLFRTYFHSTCGGATRSADRVFGEPSILPLGGVVCDACAGTQFAGWELYLKRSAVETAFARAVDESALDLEERAADRIELSILDADAIGFVERLRVATTEGVYAWRTDRALAALRETSGARVRSQRFEISDGPGDGFTLHGRGFGHGVGLCQVGAGGLARRGLDEREILAHYYPGSELRRAFGASAPDVEPSRVHRP